MAPRTPRNLIISDGLPVIFTVEVSRYFPTLPDGSWKVDGPMTVPASVEKYGMFSGDLLISFLRYLEDSRAEAGLYRVGDFKVLWADGTIEVVT